MSFGDIEFYDDQNAPKSLYVGHLHPKVTEELLSELFSKYGVINSCKMFPETPGQDPYAFVEFKKRDDADHARAAMNDRRIFDKNIIVRFATNKSNQKRDLSNDYHIFVGDLSPEIEPTDLAKAFQPYGKITSVRIMKDNNTGKSKGFAFLSFQTKVEAEKAIEDMNGQFIGSRQIRTNWASRKGPGEGDNAAGAGKGPGFKAISYKEALNSSTPTNTTVYFGNLPENTSDGELRGIVSGLGNIADVKLFADKRYAFIRMTTHEEAAMCIHKLHGLALRESYVKCFWGKEYTGNNQGNQQMGGGGGHDMPFNQGSAGGGGGGPGGPGYHQGNQDYSQYVQNFWNQYYQQYYQYMDPNTYNQYGPGGQPGGPGGPPQQYDGPPMQYYGGDGSNNNQYMPPTQQYNNNVSGSHQNYENSSYNGSS